MKITTIGLDIVKSACHAHGVDESGEVVLRRRPGRAEVLFLLAKPERRVVGIEARATAHHWGREPMSRATSASG